MEKRRIGQDRISFFVCFFDLFISLFSWSLYWKVKEFFIRLLFVKRERLLYDTR